MAAPVASENVLLFSTLSILQLIKEAQQQHGLRHGDYQRYRGYCSRKLRRIRKSLHFTNAHKHKSTFQSKSVNTDVAANDLRFLLIPLFEAERSWAYAMQLKQEANTEPRKRYAVVSKLKRAVQHTQNLEDICKAVDKVDAPTKLEGQAYNAWLHGCLNFELKQWAKAMEYLNTSKKIYENLSALVNSSGDQNNMADVYHQRCQEMTPQLRYCAFSVGDESAATVDDLIRMKTEIQAGGEQQENLLITSDLDKLIAEARQKQAATAAQKMAFEVVWCKHKIATDKPAKVQSFITSLQQFDAQLKQAANTDAKVALYERLLIDCRDAIQAVRDDAKTENLKIKRGVDDSDVEGSPPPVQANDQSFSPAQLLHSYLVYVRFSKTIDRYLLMIDQLRSGSNSDDSQKQQPVDVPNEDGKQKSKKKKQKEDLAAAQQNAAGEKSKAKPLDLVRLYDTVLQNLSDISALPGVQHDQKFMNEIDAKSTYFRAFRCYCVAQSFGQQKKWREALALYDRALEYAQKAKQAMKKVKIVDDNGHVSESALEELCNVVNAAKYCAHANSVLEASPSAMESNATQADTGGGKPILDTLDLYRRIIPSDLTPAKLASATPPVSLVRLPPDFQAMPCKPMFFDLALNHVQFPSLEEKLVEEGGGRAAAKGSEGGGLTGIMKGWLWGSKK